VKTLIELYDERPLENVLNIEVFQPERVVYLCPKEIAANDAAMLRLKRFFRRRGVKSKLIFVGADMYNAKDLIEKLQQVLSHYPDCAIDITGGTDDELFAAGLVAASRPKLPVFTYSRRKNSFFNIMNADFADRMLCPVRYSVEDCFVMAGGAMRPGRVDNSVLEAYLSYIDPFFRLYLRHRREWVSFTTYMQRVSAPDRDGVCRLEVDGAYTVKGEHGHTVSADEPLLRELEELGFLRELSIAAGERVRFKFLDLQVRAWLRDVGSVLELYTYKACIDTGRFQDVITSAVVDWEAIPGQNAVTNELDVMATRGVTPVFISCKTCDVKTEALNELAILKERFGGEIARAAIVSAERGGSAMRSRAQKLGITVIDLEDLEEDRISELLANLVADLP